MNLYFWAYISANQVKPDDIDSNFCLLYTLLHVHVLTRKHKHLLYVVSVHVLTRRHNKSTSYFTLFVFQQLTELMFVSLQET